MALDGRIEPGDMILEVNGVSFENMSNDDAVRTLRESVQKPGYVLAEELMKIVKIFSAFVMQNFIVTNLVIITNARI